MGEPESVEATATVGDPVVPVVVAEGAQLPRYALPGDAGADLTTTVDLTLAPGQRAVVPTGVRLALPQGHVGLVNPRSGLAARRGLTIVNAPGTIDSGYRGEIKVALLNTDPHEPVELHAGDRIAQLVVVPFVRARFVLVDDLDETWRGESGYGSTGVGDHSDTNDGGPRGSRPDDDGTATRPNTGRHRDQPREGHDR